MHNYGNFLTVSEQWQYMVDFVPMLQLKCITFRWLSETAAPLRRELYVLYNANISMLS